MDFPEPPSFQKPVSKDRTSNATSVPPGLSLPQDFPPLAAPSKPVAPVKSQRKAATTNAATPAIKPVVPVLPTTAPRVAGPSKEGYLPDAESATASKPTDTSALEHGLKLEPRTEVLASQTLLSSSAKVTPKTGASADQSEPKSMQDPPKTGKEAKSGKSSQTAEKRQPPGKLDIAAAKDASKQELESVAASSGPSKSIEPGEFGRQAVSGISQPSTPATAASQASLPSATRPNQPRTIRTIPTQKAETPPRAAAASPSVAAAIAGSAAGKQVSRRGSFASIHPPGTPMSEKISDNASVTSNSMSRASSPPPSRVGSAPVRQVTKSQQKKERQARAKQAEESSKTEEAPVKAVVEEPVQAPIIGRKKKTKKTATRGTADSTPSVSRPASPPPREESNQESTPATPVKETKRETSKVEAKKEEVESPMSPSFTSTDPHQKPSLTAASIFANLEKAGAISSAIQEYFKGVSGLNHRFDTAHTDIETINHIPTLNNAQHRELQKGEAICVELANNKRIVILPDHRTLHGLSHDQAQRYLALRRQALSTGDLAMFNSTRREIDRYLPIAPIVPPATIPTANIRNSSDDDEENLNLELVNRFVAPPSSTQPISMGRQMPGGFCGTVAEEQQRGMGMGGAMMGMEEAEQALLQSRKETEGLEKKLNGLLKRNRRLVFGNAH